MCVACAEFIKGRLKLNEFKNALKETTRENLEHLREVNETVQEASSGGQIDTDRLREKLRLKNSSSPSSES